MLSDNSTLWCWAMPGVLAFALVASTISKQLKCIAITNMIFPEGFRHCPITGTAIQRSAKLGQKDDLKLLEEYTDQVQKVLESWLPVLNRNGHDSSVSAASPAKKKNPERHCVHRWGSHSFWWHRVPSVPLPTGSLAEAIREDTGKRISKLEQTTWGLLSFFLTRHQKWQVFYPLPVMIKCKGDFGKRASCFPHCTPLIPLTSSSKTTRNTSSSLMDLQNQLSSFLDMGAAFGGSESMQMRVCRIWRDYLHRSWKVKGHHISSPFYLIG